MSLSAPEEKIEIDTLTFAHEWHGYRCAIWADLLLIDVTSCEKLCTTVPKFEPYFRFFLQNNYIATHRRVVGSISKSALGRYLELLARYPAIVQRVAQRHIASYLRITPEALSRIMRRLAKAGQ